MMRMGSTSRLRALAIVAVLVGASSALAQDAPPAGASDEVPAELETPQDQAEGAPKIQSAPAGVSGSRRGTGFSLDADGNSRLHLRLDVGAGFDTNPYAVPFGTDTGQFPGDIVTRVRPGLELKYPGSLIAFDGDLFVDYGFLPNVFGGGAQANWLLYQAAVNGALEVNRGGMFSFAVRDMFATNNDAGVVALGTIFNRLTNNLGVGVGWRPGGGTLRLRLAYNFGFEKWFEPNFGLFGPEASDPVRQGAFDQMSHGATLRVDYRFLPKTGTFAELSGGWNSFPFDQFQVNPNSFPVGVRVGVMGQMTPKLSGLAAIGYQNPLVVDTLPGGGVGVTTATVIGLAGQAEVRWTITPTTRLGGGVMRQFRPAPLYQYVTNNRFYARFDQAIGAKFVFSAFAGYSILQFGEEQAVIVGGQPQDLTDTVGTDRLDGHLDFRAVLSYYMLDWLSFGISNDLDWRATNASDASGGTNFGYLANETLVLASLHY